MCRMQVAELQELRQLIHRQLAATPDGGDEFCDSVQAILADEEHWIAWKKDGCKDFARPPYPAQLQFAGGVAVHALKAHAALCLTPHSNGKCQPACAPSSWQLERGT